MKKSCTFKSCMSLRRGANATLLSILLFAVGCGGEEEPPPSQFSAAADAEEFGPEDADEALRRAHAVAEGAGRPDEDEAAGAETAGAEEQENTFRTINREGEGDGEGEGEGGEGEEGAGSGS